ncbi:MAG: hypothetical protein MJ182_05325 [Treponema sp.]|nr:hypothetical protein [Treponema sp.]
MKKFLGIIFTCLLFASCENFLTGNLDTANKMAEEVRYNTAAQILVSVVSDHGTVVTGFNRDARVGIPFEIELSLPKNSGVFEKWYAVVRDKDNNETPLTSDDIIFENENSLKTNVTLLKEIRGVYVVAKVHENPVLSISYDNIDFYSKNSTSEAKSLIANQVRLTGNESFSYQNFVIQTTNDYGISFGRIKFISSDGVEEIDIPVYTLDQFYALGENIPEPYTYIINCEDGNPETKSDNDGSYYSSAVTNSLLCLFNVTENNLPEGAVKVSFNACLFHNLESMVYVKPKVDSYLKILGNVEGYENTTITPNAPKVVLPSKDLSFKISIPDQYSYDSLSFSTESGAVPDVYISDSDTVDETLEEVKSAAFAIYSLYVETTDSNAYETKTTVSFNVKSINGFSETVIIKPVLNINSILIPVSKKNENSIDPMVSEVRFHPGKDYTFTVSSVPGYNLNDLFLRMNQIQSYIHITRQNMIPLK